MASPIDDLMKSYQSLLQQGLTLAQSFSASGSSGIGSMGAENAADAGTVSRAMLQALTAATASSLSYSYSVQSILYKYQASFLALSLGEEETKHKRAILIDEIRGFLREIGETANREGRSFQHQLILITEQLAQAEAQQKQEAQEQDNRTPNNPAAQ
jgi:hypothetical protein